MPVDVVVINLTRFGDLLQSQSAIDDLRKNGHRTGLVCLDNFSAALPLLRNVDMAWPLPGASLLANLQRDWPKACQLAGDFAKKIINEGRPRHIVNLTPTLPARLLARMLAWNGAQILGFGMDEFGYGVNHGLWSSFVAVAAQKRGNSPFNISDVLRMLAAPINKTRPGSARLAPPAKADLDWACEFIAKNTAPFSIKPQGYAAFQLGASEDIRRWPVEHFAEMGAILWREANICPILTGAKSEMELARKYGSCSSAPFIDAIGRTDIPRLGAILASCKLLASNDTGTLHLASGLGTPSLSFYLGAAQPCDTGPTLSNCCCLEPALDCHPCEYRQKCENGRACRGHISAATAAGLIAGFLESGSWTKGMTPEMEGQCRIWLTGIDANNLCEVIPLNHAANSGASLWMRWQRAFWEQALLGGSYQGSGYANLPCPTDATQVGEALVKISALMDTISECALAAAATPALAKILLRNCERLQAMLDEIPQLNSLAAFWREYRASQSGELNEFAQSAKSLANHIQLWANAVTNNGT